MIKAAIHNCFIEAIRKKWNKVYWAFDIHGVITLPTYIPGTITKNFYPDAKEVLQLISKRKDICMFLYTCSHPEEIKQYQEFFAEHNINFVYANENPEVATLKGGYGNYEKKPYFNVLFEDKAGFVPLTDWLEVKKLLATYDESVLAPFNKK